MPPLKKQNIGGRRRSKNEENGPVTLFLAGTPEYEFFLREGGLKWPKILQKFESKYFELQ